ncbi:hypothetical protein D4R99_03840 [bacterium]|nr:MAG: hypothetical protein D4R99_03840 [bacterium]
MNTQAITYLRENKGKYSQEDLKKSLLSAGYSENEVEESMKEVFSGSVTETPLPVPPPIYVSEEQKSENKRKSFYIWMFAILANVLVYFIIAIQEAKEFLVVEALIKPVSEYGLLLIASLLLTIVPLLISKSKSEKGKNFFG